MSDKTDQPDQRSGEASDHDPMEIRCPKLGGQVTFGYCRREGGSLPCQRALVCWGIYFPVEAHLKARMSDDEWRRCFMTPVKPRVASLLECIEAAKQRVAGGS